MHRVATAPPTNIVLILICSQSDIHSLSHWAHPLSFQAPSISISLRRQIQTTPAPYNSCHRLQTRLPISTLSSEAFAFDLAMANVLGKILISIYCITLWSTLLFKPPGPWVIYMLLLILVISLMSFWPASSQKGSEPSWNNKRPAPGRW